MNVFFALKVSKNFYPDLIINHQILIMTHFLLIISFKVLSSLIGNVNGPCKPSICI